MTQMLMFMLTLCLDGKKKMKNNLKFSLIPIGVQCDEDPLLLESRRLQEEVRLLKEEVRQLKWGVGKIKDNDTRTRFYTGLPTFAVFLWLYKFHDPCAGCFPVIPDP
ncbi:uncharacterized protein LOC110463026 isoform X2 [Mizuhopecten yessoensis]|uniref:uncharacterized protein LOC110463026 isoform X2 n=1 Tax=Mizuhopecten yessoensis TaxID=6573 RepID=UPI000B45C5C1|nr:uncharacterized protein LOC110463026 isoform X2 [Mizuhopecten yessoensis]